MSGHAGGVQMGGVNREARGTAVRVLRRFVANEADGDWALAMWPHSGEGGEVMFRLPLVSGGIGRRGKGPADGDGAAEAIYPAIFGTIPGTHPGDPCPLDEDELKLLERVELFLRTDLAYEWPPGAAWAWRGGRFSGKRGAVTRRYGGELDAWPFRTARQLEEAQQRFRGPGRDDDLPSTKNRAVWERRRGVAERIEHYLAGKVVIADVRGGHWYAMADYGLYEDLEAYLAPLPAGKIDEIADQEMREEVRRTLSRVVALLMTQKLYRPRSWARPPKEVLELHRREGSDFESLFGDAMARREARGEKPAKTPAREVSELEAAIGWCVTGVICGVMGWKLTTRSDISPLLVFGVGSLLVGLGRLAWMGARAAARRVSRLCPGGGSGCS